MELLIALIAGIAVGAGLVAVLGRSRIAKGMGMSFVLGLIALNAVVACAWSADSSFRCAEGTVDPKHSYQLLSVSMQGDKLTRVQYENQTGPSLSGSFFGCSAIADRKDTDQLWRTKGPVTRVAFGFNGKVSATDPSLVIEDRGSEFVVTFDGNTSYFCGAQSSVPEKVVLNKASQHCKFDGPFM